MIEIIGGKNSPGGKRFRYRPSKKVVDKVDNYHTVGFNYINKTLNDLPIAGKYDGKIHRPVAPTDTREGRMAFIKDFLKNNVS